MEKYCIAVLKSNIAENKRINGKSEQVRFQSTVYRSKCDKSLNRTSPTQSGRSKTKVAGVGSRRAEIQRKGDFRLL